MAHGLLARNVNAYAISLEEDAKRNPRPRFEFELLDMGAQDEYPQAVESIVRTFGMREGFLQSQPRQDQTASHHQEKLISTTHRRQWNIYEECRTAHVIPLLAGAMASCFCWLSFHWLDFPWFTQ
jgi:hypothetical protein